MVYNPITCEYHCGGMCTVLHSDPNRNCTLRREEGESDIKEFFGIFFEMKPFYNTTLEDLGGVSRFVKLINGSL